MEINLLLQQINKRLSKIEHDVKKLKKKQNKRITMKITKSAPVKMYTSKSATEGFAKPKAEQNLVSLSRISKGNPTTNEKIDNVVNLSPKKITKTATKLKEALEELGTSEN